MSNTLVIDGKQLALDKEGYLKNLNDWSPDIAERLATLEEIILKPEHWEVIELLRDFYQQRELSPSMRILVKLMNTEYGPVKGTSLYLLSLFPGSPAKISSKIAGLPRPTNCL